MSFDPPVRYETIDGLECIIVGDYKTKASAGTPLDYQYIAASYLKKCPRRHWIINMLANLWRNG